MLQAVEKYAEMIQKLEIPQDTVNHAKEIFEAVPQILTDL